jgi:hypothetical protein
MELKQKIIALFVASNILFAMCLSSFCVQKGAIAESGISSSGIFSFVLDTTAPINAINAIVKKIILNEEFSAPLKTKNEKQKEAPANGVAVTGLFAQSNQIKLIKKNKDSLQFKDLSFAVINDKYIPDKNIRCSSSIAQMPAFVLLFMLLYLAILFRNVWAKKITSYITAIRLCFNTAVFFYFEDGLL